MAKSEKRVKITLECTECKRRNYITMKSKINDRERLEMKKYCPRERKHTVAVRHVALRIAAVECVRDDFGVIGINRRMRNGRQPARITHHRHRLRDLYGNSDTRPRSRMMSFKLGTVLPACRILGHLARERGTHVVGANRTEFRVKRRLFPR